MNKKQVFSIFLALFGEVILIFSFLYLGKNLKSEILLLNIIVSTLIYSLVFFDLAFPWINLKDKSQKQIGSLGIRWYFTFLYVVISIGCMIYFNSIRPIEFMNQIIVYSIINFLLLLGVFMGFSSSEKVQEVFTEEKQNRDRLDDMKKATKGLQLKLDAMNNVPMEIINRINELQENLRYLSPSNNNDAIVLEGKFVEELSILSNSFDDSPINMEKVISNIKNCERTYKERKQVFSN